MRKLLCKVFRFLLDLVSQVVDLVANTLIKIGTAAVEVLSEVASAIGSKLLSNPVVLIGLGVAAYLLWPKGKEDDSPPARSDGLVSLPARSDGLVSLDS